jgi:hypothetical protein
MLPVRLASVFLNRFHDTLIPSYSYVGPSKRKSMMDLVRFFVFRTYNVYLNKENFFCIGWQITRTILI